MKYITAFFMAWGNFFAVPCPCKLWDNNLRRLQVVFLPIIGIAMGMLWYLLYLGTAVISLPISLQTAVLTIYPFAVCGLIHLDGFMDCCDAILSRRELEERQRILKDSHVGAFAVICVVILFVILYSAMWAAVDSAQQMNGISANSIAALAVIPFFSRICSSFGVLSFVPIGHSQYKESFNKSINKKYSLTLVLLALIGGGGLLWLGLVKIAAVALVTMVTHFTMMKYGRIQLGGMSGDIAGYALTISECAAVVVLAII